MRVFVTGAAGFIGYHLCRRLAQAQQAEVLGIDSLNDYYPVELKRARLAQLEGGRGFRFMQADFADADALNRIYDEFRPDYVVHLGAQAGVRYSLQNPAAYAQSNLVGFTNVLEAVRRHPPKHTVFASSSSVYGINAQVPFHEDDITHQPLSFYAATKQANEVMAYSYARLYGLHFTGLRFFTVYGPWGRPDMAPVMFARAICSGETVKLYNRGLYRRDFTYVDDVIEGLWRVLTLPPAAEQELPFRIFNIGHNRPVEMRLFVQLLERLLGRTAKVELLPPLPTEMQETCADLTRIHAAVGYAPQVSLEDGLRRFIYWFRSYYGFV